MEESENYKKLFGTKIVERAYISIGENSKTLRESGNMYVRNDGTLNFTQQGYQVKEHKFFGKEVS